MKALLALVTSAAALAGFGGIFATAHDNYGGNTNSWQLWRHYEKMATVTNGGAKVVFVGDSITHGWEGTQTGNRYFSEGDWKMLNLGTSGDRIEHVLWRINEGGELDGYEAKCVLLMIGTNNASTSRKLSTMRCMEVPADMILGIREILRTIRRKQPKATVVLMPIFPRGRDATDKTRIRNEIVNGEIRKFADGKTILWCDFNDQFLTVDGRLPVEVFPDFLHPNDEGREIWYSAVKPYIAAALSDGRIPMPPNRYATFQRRESLRLDNPVATFPVALISSGGVDAHNWWLDRLQRNREQIMDSDCAIDVAMIGDSITHNWDGPGHESLAELRKTYSVLNAGYSGDRTEHVLWRLKYGGELDGYRAKCVTLMIGTNNTGHRRDKPESIAAGIREILDVVAEKQPQAKVLLMPIFPVGDGPKDARRVNNEAVNAIVKGYADGKKVVWLDFNAKFLDEKGDVAKWMPDRLHPNADGYREIWMPALLPHLKEACGK